MVRLYYDDREGQELARLDSCDILESPLSETVDYPRVVALEHVAEMLDELLPDREANDAIFRLAVSVLHQLRTGPIWMPLTYFQLWLVRLVGFLPEMGECLACGATLNGDRAYYHVLADGLMCSQHKRLASSQLAPESRALAVQMFRAPVESFTELRTTESATGDAVMRGGVGAAQLCRLAKVSHADHRAPHREETGNRQHAGEAVSSGEEIEMCHPQRSRRGFVTATDESKLFLDFLGIENEGSFPASSTIISLWPWSLARHSASAERGSAVSPGRKPGVSCHNGSESLQGRHKIAGTSIPAQRDELCLLPKIR